MAEDCCQVYILCMMFCHSDCRLWACGGKWLCNQETPRSRTLFDFTPTDQCGIWKIFFNLILHILPWQRHIGARIILCRCISIKRFSVLTHLHVYWLESKSSLKWLDCGRKIQNNIHIDTYLLQARTHIVAINLPVFDTCFLFRTDQKCTESSTYWQFFYYRPPGKFRERSLKCDAKNSTYIYIYLSPSR